jgi:hypothetical protein
MTTRSMRMIPMLIKMTMHTNTVVPMQKRDHGDIRVLHTPGAHINMHRCVPCTYVYTCILRVYRAHARAHQAQTCTSNTNSDTRKYVRALTYTDAHAHKNTNTNTNTNTHSNSYMNTYSPTQGYEWPLHTISEVCSSARNRPLAYAHAYPHEHAHVHAHAHAEAWPWWYTTCVFIYRAHTCTWVHANKRVHIVGVFTCIHAYTHTCIHVYTHTW